MQSGRLCASTSSRTRSRPRPLAACAAAIRKRHCSCVSVRVSTGTLRYSKRCCAAAPRAQAIELLGQQQHLLELATSGCASSAQLVGKTPNTSRSERRRAGWRWCRRARIRHHRRLELRRRLGARHQLAQLAPASGSALVEHASEALSLSRSGRRVPAIWCTSLSPPAAIGLAVELLSVLEERGSAGSGPCRSHRWRREMCDSPSAKPLGLAAPHLRQQRRRSPTPGARRRRLVAQHQRVAAAGPPPHRRAQAGQQHQPRQQLHMLLALEAAQLTGRRHSAIGRSIAGTAKSDRYDQLARRLAPTMACVQGPSRARRQQHLRLVDHRHVDGRPVLTISMVLGPRAHRGRHISRR